MRLWTISPAYLDAKGLLAAWREGLLALKVLKGLTRGYRNHPQLCRFREGATPVPSLLAYLSALAEEADRRGYRFDRSRFAANGATGTDLGGKAAAIPVTLAQIEYEGALLLRKLREREPDRTKPLEEALGTQPGPGIALNPVFYPVPGEIAEWERPVEGVLRELRERELRETRSR